MSNRDEPPKHRNDDSIFFLSQQAGDNLSRGHIVVDFIPLGFPHRDRPILVPNLLALLFRSLNQ